MAVVHGEVPVKRYWGIEKRPGPQYVRGIIEGNGNPPDDDLWVVYSVNKEDIWESRIPVPIKRTINKLIKDDFNKMEIAGLVQDWNIYSPLWCPVKVVKGPDSNANNLMLKDFDPYDYARATRVFGQAEMQRLSFELFIESNPQSFCIDICNDKGKRLIKLYLDNKNIVHTSNGEKSIQNNVSLEKGKWHNVGIDYNSTTYDYDININNDFLVIKNKFTTEGNPERIEFRTGEYRLNRKITEYKSGDPKRAGWDEPNADVPVEEAVFYIRNFSTELIK